MTGRAQECGNSSGKKTPRCVSSVEKLISVYREGLLEDVVPFWIDHAVDRKRGGYLFCLDRSGSVFDTDKPMWLQSRFVWLLATLYDTVAQREQWLELARHGVDFILSNGFDADGRMFFMVDREGRPLRKRRYLFTECFAVLALAAFGHAADEPEHITRALDLFRGILRYHEGDGLLEPKVFPATRSAKSLSMLMMIVCMAQELNRVSDDPLPAQRIDRALKEIQIDFIKADPYRVLETVGPGGEIIDHIDGRLVTPGHVIETAWFILHEARCRGGDRTLVELGCRMLDWAWEFGWDREYGGILCFRDVTGHPCTEYWHDMKFWWPHNEAIIATLLAYFLTGDDKYAAWHDTVHTWTYSHFPDPDYGEWIGYLHRDGSISSTLKGNMWKGPYHVPRMQWYCWKLLSEFSSTSGSGMA